MAGIVEYRDTGRAASRWTLVALCLAVLVAQIDTAVVNLATRPIGEAFGADIVALQWVIDSYNLVYAVLLLTGGLLADLYGRRRVFMAGAAIFTVASLLCALAPNITLLIIGRALTGVGSACLLPASLAIIRVAWPEPAARGRVLGIWAACNGVAMAIGPTLGGLVIGGFGWRGIFLLVLPLSVAAWLLAIRHIPESSDTQGRHLDLPAQFLGAVVLAGAALAAIELRDSPLLAGFAVALAGAALVLFLRVEAGRGAGALVPLDLFAIRRFRAAVVTTFAMTFGMYGILFLLPLFWLEAGRLDAVAAGLALIPMALLFVAVSPFSGSVTQRFGDRAVTSGGVAVIGCGLLLIALGADRQALTLTEIGLALTGIGMGLATGPLMAVAFGAVSAGRAGTAGSLINVARMSGATIGVACLGALFALGQGAAGGLRLAMLTGGIVQIGCAFWAWRNTAA